MNKYPDISITIITNGKLFNEEMCKELFKSECFNANISVSFDNFSVNNYKKVNPNTSLQNIMKIDKMARATRNETEKSRNLLVHGVISRKNFYKIKKYLLFFYEKDIYASLSIVVPFVIKDNPKDFNEFNQEEYDLIIKQLEELLEMGKLVFSNVVLLDFLIKYKNKNFDPRKVCRAGVDAIFNRNDGEVFPCLTESVISGKFYGNLIKNPFDTITTNLQKFTCQIDEPSFFCYDQYLMDAINNDMKYIDSNLCYKYKNSINWNKNEIPISCLKHLPENRFRVR